VREVNEVLEAAIGGMTVSTTVDGRARYTMNVRFGADYREDVDALARHPGPGADRSRSRGGRQRPGHSGAGLGTDSGRLGAWAAMAWAAWAAAGASGDGAAQHRRAPRREPMRSSRFRIPRAAVPLGELADIRVTSGPPMIRDEDGVLVGYVYADIDLSTARSRRLGRRREGAGR
jgi:Cu(I)/Ag(I) efflux system membrane protein CusA/SilA